MKNVDYDEKTKTLIRQEKRRMIDANTGEEVYLDQINKISYGSKNFWKCYLMDFLTVLGIINSKQLDVFIFIVENTNPATNMFVGTYDHIAKQTHVSRPTIATIMKKLQEAGLIKKVQNGLWLVNPNLLMKGGEHKRQILLSYYESEDPVDEISYCRTKQPMIPNALENVSELNTMNQEQMIEEGGEK